MAQPDFVHMNGGSMKRLTPRTVLYLAIDVALLLACLYHISSLRERPGVPFNLVDEGGRIVVQTITDSAACPGFCTGDTLLAWENRTLRTEHDLEFLSDFRAIGERVSLQRIREGVAVNGLITLIPFFSLRYALLVLFVGIITWGVGVFVLVVRPGDLTASVLHWSMICMAVVVMIMWGATPRGALWSYFSRGLFFVVYTGVATNFLFFTALFPRPRSGSLVRRAVIVYGPGLLLGASLIVLHWRALSSMSLAVNESFRTLYDVFHLALLLCVGAGILNFIRSYHSTESFVERKKLQWVLWGLSIGPAPFLLLQILPELFIPVSPVPEEYTLVFLVIVPLSFAVSFVKYHLLNIEVVINRTTVYAVVVSALVVAYILLVGTVALIVGTYTVGASTAAAVLVALGFEPARRRVQQFVDRRFFRVRYDFRQAERRFVEEMKRCIDTQQLAGLIIRKTNELIPVQRSGFFKVEQPGNRLLVVAHENFDQMERHGVRFESDKLKTPLELPVALDDRIEAGVVHESADPVVFHRWGVAVVFPMLAQEGGSLGFLVLGEKKSGVRFSSEDVDLLLNVATQAGLEMERIVLQHELLQKQAEAERFKELNDLKSDFVSYVSHELKTPLTSIKIFAELLRARARPPDRKSLEYLKIIEGESDRLDRMVTTILDSARIDQGVQEYHFRDADLAEITRSVMKAMHYQLSKHGFSVRLTGLSGGRRYPVHVDCDAAMEAIINLVANSIKYSAGRKYLKIALSRKNGLVRCAVEDHGRGIPPEALSHIFEKFYRDPEQRRKVQGVGLGLPLVKHIMDAHGGEVKVKSAPGRGSVFSLTFPLRINRLTA
jgi:signal transduction histidine kinase